jgi:predicted HicB family RNase H-like nuclease
MNYKGYEAIVKFDEDAHIFHGDVINTRDVITFQGSSVAELEQAFKDSVDDYLEFCASRGEQPEKPYSGKFIVRLKPATHRDIALQARREGKSINRYVADVLRRAKAKAVC